MKLSLESRKQMSLFANKIDNVKITKQTTSILEELYAEIYTAKGKNVASAKLARDFVRDSLFRCMKLVPAVPGFFTAFAKVFCDLGKTINPELAGIAKSVFVSKNMMPASIKMNLQDNKEKIKVREEKEEMFLFDTGATLLKNNKNYGISFLDGTLFDKLQKKYICKYTK